MSDREADMPDLSYARGDPSTATYGVWGPENAEKIVVQQTAGHMTIIEARCIAVSHVSVLSVLYR
eukprot:7740422-Pyramimonas_sp.AAC.1